MWKLDISSYDGELIESESILDALANEHIVEITKNEDGTFNIIEKCDKYYGGTLTKEQLLALAEEIRLLAES